MASLVSLIHCNFCWNWLLLGDTTRRGIILNCNPIKERRAVWYYKTSWWWRYWLEFLFVRTCSGRAKIHYVLRTAIFSKKLKLSFHGDFNNLQHEAQTSAFMKVIHNLCGTPHALHTAPYSQHGEHRSTFQCLAGGKLIPCRIKENSGIKWWKVRRSVSLYLWEVFGVGDVQ